MTQADLNIYLCGQPVNVVSCETYLYKYTGTKTCGLSITQSGCSFSQNTNQNIADISLLDSFSSYSTKYILSSSTYIIIDIIFCIIINIYYSTKYIIIIIINIHYSTKYIIIIIINIYYSTKYIIIIIINIYYSTKYILSSSTYIIVRNI